MNKISHYFSTLEITRGFFIALLNTAFIYLSYWGFMHPLLASVLGLLSLYLLLASNTKTWFFFGAFTGLFWFWWISLSLKYYEMSWAIPIELFIIMLSYGIIFALIAKIASIPAGCCALTTSKIHSKNIRYSFVFKWCCQGTAPYLISLTIKASGLLIVSYIHPFGFDWFKPELVFVESYFGIKKIQFSVILLGLSLALWKKQLPYLLLTLFALEPMTSHIEKQTKNIALITTYTSVKDKWNEHKYQAQFDAILKTIDGAIAEKKSLVILPESVFPIFLNRSEVLMDELKHRAKHISIVIGALYWDGKTPRNSTYIFANGKIRIANKVVLVPFGEKNPLPDFLSDWVNEVFYDGAVDYKADENVTDYKVNSITYRNAICFEGTSEKLYKGNPKNMILLSNNGWFSPSIEPTLQKLLLQYYSKKYGTTIYHSVNMSESYVIKNGNVSN